MPMPPSEPIWIFSAHGAQGGRYWAHTFLTDDDVKRVRLLTDRDDVLGLSDAVVVLVDDGPVSESHSLHAVTVEIDRKRALGHIRTVFANTAHHLSREEHLCFDALPQQALPNNDFEVNAGEDEGTVSFSDPKVVPRVPRPDDRITEKQLKYVLDLQKKLLKRPIPDALRLEPYADAVDLEDEEVFPNIEQLSKREASALLEGLVAQERWRKRTIRFAEADACSLDVQGAWVAPADAIQTIVLCLPDAFAAADYLPDDCVLLGYDSPGNNPLSGTTLSGTFADGGNAPPAASSHYLTQKDWVKLYTMDPNVPPGDLYTFPYTTD